MMEGSTAPSSLKPPKASSPSLGRLDVSPLAREATVTKDTGSVSARSHQEAAARAKHELEKTAAGSLSARTFQDAAARAGAGMSPSASPALESGGSTRSYTEVVSRVVRLWEQDQAVSENEAGPSLRTKHDTGLPSPAVYLGSSWSGRRSPLIRKLNVRDKYELGEEVGRGNWSKVFAAQYLNSAEAEGEGERKEGRNWFGGRRSKRTGARAEEDASSHASSQDDDVPPVEHMAVKTIDKIKLASRGAMETPHKEAEALHCLSSCCPNEVVRLVEALEDNWSFYLVLERCHGGNLNKQLSPRGGKLSEEETKVVLRRLLIALAHCSMHGIVHRDVKLENLLLAQKKDLNTVKLCDFGLAVFVPPGGTVSGCMGTAPYAAPEVVLGEPYDCTADMWSAGVVAYTLLAGGRPFWGQKLSQVLHAVINEELKFEGKAWENTSPEAVDFLRMLLRKDWRRRPSAVQALCHPWIYNHAVGDMIPLDSRLLFPPVAPAAKKDTVADTSRGVKPVQEGKNEGVDFDDDAAIVAGVSASTLTVATVARLQSQLMDRYVASQQLCVLEFKESKEISKPQKSRVKALGKLGREGLRAEAVTVLAPIFDRH